jgi:hypothetical protein
VRAGLVCAKDEALTTTNMVKNHAAEEIRMCRLFVITHLSLTACAMTQCKTKPVPRSVEKQAA